MTSESTRLEKALEYWRSDMGYVQINDLLSKKIHGGSRYKKRIYVDDSANAARHLQVLLYAMESADKAVVLYRGGTVVSSIKDHKREGLISLSSDYEQALAFMDGKCCVYQVTVHPEVLRIKTGTEKETLVEPYCYWVNTGKNTVTLLPPEETPKDFIWYGEIEALAKKVEAEVKREQSKQRGQAVEVQLERKQPSEVVRATALYDELLEEIGDLLDLETLIISAKPYKIPEHIIRTVWSAKTK